MMKFEDNSKAVKKAISGAIEKSLAEIGVTIKNDAKTIVPVDTGDLRRSIDFNVKKADGSVIIGAGMEYAPDVEFGREQREQPYLRPAFRSNRQGAEDILKKNLGAIK